MNYILVRATRDLMRFKSDGSLKDTISKATLLRLYPDDVKKIRGIKYVYVTKEEPRVELEGGYVEAKSENFAYEMRTVETTAEKSVLKKLLENLPDIASAIITTVSVIKGTNPELASKFEYTLKSVEEEIKKEKEQRWIIIGGLSALIILGLFFGLKRR
jgi:LPXTG-motif cell wall-anchored protein